MTLDRYRQKRNFARTPEPAPAEPAPGTAGHATPPDTTSVLMAAPAGCGRFVIHRHRASRLHYDLRLEVDGVLASWALPRGPTRDPDERRFAARTEDHPIEYLDFEGVIPAREYGAGDSICWDWGTFEPELTWDPGEALRAGELKFRIRGEKLAGRFTLVRTSRHDRGRAAGQRGESGGPASGDPGESWLLIAKAGPEAIPGWDPEAHPASVRTGRTNEEVAAGVPPPVDRPAPAPLPSLDPPGARITAQPAFVEPMLATPGTAPFDDEDWLFEPKWDGYRIQAIVANGSVALRTRNRHDAGRLFPELLGKPSWLAAPEAIVDGEVVALDANGRPDFGLLQARLGGGFSGSDVPASGRARDAGRSAPLVFMAFDLPWCAGRSYLDVPLEDRKAILRLVLREHPRVRFGGHVEHEGIAFFAAAAAQGLEGAMAKHRRSRYEAGRRSTSAGRRPRIAGYRLGRSDGGATSVVTRRKPWFAAFRSVDRSILIGWADISRRLAASRRWAASRRLAALPAPGPLASRRPAFPAPGRQPNPGHPTGGRDSDRCRRRRAARRRRRVHVAPDPVSTGPAAGMSRAVRLASCRIRLRSLLSSIPRGLPQALSRGSRRALPSSAARSRRSPARSCSGKEMSRSSSVS